MWMLALACSGKTEPTGSVLPTVQIVAPADGAEVTATLDVTVEVTEFTFAAPTATASLGWPFVAWSTAAAHEAGEEPNGYVEWSVDGAVVGRLAEASGTLDLSGVASGAHTLRAELKYPDGDGFYPTVDHQISITRTP